MSAPTLSSPAPAVGSSPDPAPSVAVAVAGDHRACEATEGACRSLAETLGATRVSVWDLDARQTLRPCVRLEHADASGRTAGPIPLKDFPAAGQALTTGRGIEIVDAASDQRLPEGFAAAWDVSSALVHPLISPSGNGVLIVEPAMPAENLLAVREIELLTASYGHGRALADAAYQRAETALLLEIMEVSAQEHGVDTALAEICVRLARHLGVRRCAAFLREDGALVAKMSRYANGDDNRSEWRQNQSQLGLPPSVVRVAGTGRPEIVASSAVRASWREAFGVGTVLTVPIGDPAAP